MRRSAGRMDPNGSRDATSATAPIIAAAASATTSVMRLQGSEQSVMLVDLLQHACASVPALGNSSRPELLAGGAGNCSLSFDRAALTEIIVREAVSNAIKYAHPTGVAGKITVACEHHPGGGIAICVTDDGVGLPEDFDPTADGGTGFRIMRAVSERLGASLTFKSTPLGLLVHLRLPNAAVDGGRAVAVAANGGADRPLRSDNTTRDLARAQQVVAGAQDHGPGRELLEALPAAVYTTDAAGRITFYNEAASALWGRRPELGESTFCGSWKLYWPDGTPLPHDQCPMAMALKEKRPIRGLEAVVERPDGTRVPMIPYPTPLFDASGALAGAVNMLVDISDRKYVEETLARQRNTQVALYQFTDELFRASSPNDVYRSALDTIRSTLGCERASILLFDEAGVMRFVAWRGLSAGYRQAVEGHSPWPRDARDPSPVCIEDMETADIPDTLRATIKSEGIGAVAFIPLVVKGELIGKFMAYYDTAHIFSEADLELAVTIARQLGFRVERMRAEDARERSEQARRLLVAIIEASDDAIVSKDLNGIITSWNRGAERLFGYTASDMIGRSIMTLMPPDRRDEERGILERIRRGVPVDHYETVRQHKDGSLIDISLSVSPVKNAAGKVIGAAKIARDITDRKRAQARQELLTREIQHRTKNLFAVVQAVVVRSFAGKQTVKQARAAVLDRLHSLAQTHAMLLDKEWQGAELGEVVSAEMSPYADRVQVEGPSLLLTANAAQNFALALHELATNAAKYGALSNTTGTVHISWSKSKSNGSGLFSFCWQERGGPPVLPPTQKGFGTAVLEHVMTEYIDRPPQVDFAADGLRYELHGSLDAVTTRGTSRA